MTTTAIADESLFPFVLPWDDSAENITNISSWSTKPAGENGFIRVHEGHLWSGDRRVRLFGVNLCFGANFPTHADAEKVAARMAKFGFNCVRFHHMDMSSAPGGIFAKDGVTLDPGQLDKLDYFIAQLKKNGIWSNLNLHVSRRYPNMPVWKEAPSFYKGVDLYYQPMIELQREYARDLLTHVNAYTGLNYASEPAIAIVEINNENGLICEWWKGALDRMPDPYASDLKVLWNRWLQRTYSSEADWKSAWQMETKESFGSLPLLTKVNFKSQPVPVRIDWMRFLWETEANYWTGMQHYLKEELQSHSLIVGSAVGFSPPYIQAKLDVVDSHAYWHHPEFHGKEWDPQNWEVVNKSMAGDAKGGTLPHLCMRRVAGKPYICTEYNASAPNTFGSEAFLLVSAYAALQDFDGIFAFAWSHRLGNWDTKLIRGFFDIDQHPAKMATMPAAAALFVRGDVQPAQNTVIEHLPEEDAIRLSTTDGSWWQAKLPNLSCLISRVALSTEPGSAAEPVLQEASDTGELTWSIADSLVTINTPRSKAWIGKIGGTTRSLDSGFTITPEETIQGWAAITLTQMSEPAGGLTGKWLVTATGYAGNTGAFWKGDILRLGQDWGSAPSIVEGIRAKIEVPVASEKVKVWALDEVGNRRAEVPVSPGEKSVIPLGPEFQTLWYEVEVMPDATK